jgi:hypothetical protein
MSTDAHDSLSPPPPEREGHRLRSGLMRALPITAGDQGDPPGGNDTASSPPGVRDDAGFTLDLSARGSCMTPTRVADAGFTLASSASGPRTTNAGCTANAGFTLALSASGPCTTPTRLAVVVEGTPLQQTNRYAGGSYSSSEDEDDSPPLLDLPAVLDQFAATPSMGDMAAASAPDTVEAVMQILSDVRGDINRLSSGSNALVELNRSTRLAVADVSKSTLALSDTMADFLRSVESTEALHRQALEASETRHRQALAAYRTSFEQSLKDITAVHTKTMDDMQSKVKSSFDRMKYLEKMFASVPERITNHLDVQLPAILTDAVGKAITPTLRTVLTEYLPPTMASVLEGPLANF